MREGQQEQSDATRVVGGVEGVTKGFEAGGVSVRRVLSARFVGFRKMCDLEVSHLSHNFVLANGVVTSNSHAITYSAISTVELWLKHKFMEEYLTALINNTKLGKKKHGSEDVLVDYVNYARRRLGKKGGRVLGPDVNASAEEFTLEVDAAGKRHIRFSIGHVKNVASSSGVVISCRPPGGYVSVQDFYDRVKTETVGEDGKKTVRRVNKKVFESLVEAGAFDGLMGEGTIAEKRNMAMDEYGIARKDKELPDAASEAEWEKRETEAIGLCLSKPPLRQKYEEFVEEKKWKLISDLSSDPKRKRVMVFGRILDWTSAISKAGNPRLDVVLSDGIDTLRFMVFMGAMQYFKDHFKKGYVAAVPLDKFEDGERRFYDERTMPVIVEKTEEEPPSTRELLRETSNGAKLFKDVGDKNDDRIVLEASPSDPELRSTSQAGHLGWMKWLADAIGDAARVVKDVDGVAREAGRSWRKSAYDGVAETAKSYGEFASRAEVILSLVYSVMVSQERWLNTKFGSDMTRMAVRRVLLEGIDPEAAANEMRSLTEGEIKGMKTYGIRKGAT